MTLEDALARTERDVDAALKAAAATTSQLKRAKKAVASGALRDLERSLDAAQQLAGAARESVRAARESWRFDDAPYLESGEFVREVIKLGESRGLSLQEQDGRIVSYPSLVRVLPNDAAVEIDRKKHRGIRPSMLVETLKALRSRPPRSRPDAFIETLARAYALVCSSEGKNTGATLKLVELYRVLTLLPGTAAAYSLQEFAMAICRLDESGVSSTKDGATMTLPASTGARTPSALATVTQRGAVKIYYGIAFQ